MNCSCRLLLLLLSVTWMGCGRGNPQVPVTGTVQFPDGSVPQGVIATITFQPADPGVGTKGASGTIEEDGTFSLLTLMPGDGALPGDYNVTVRVMDGYPQGRLLVADDYTKADATPLKATVEAGRENRFDFVVERP